MPYFTTFHFFCFLSEEVRKKLSKEAKKLIEEKLSDKEKEVVFLILKGLSNDAIAEKMGISPRTVKAHITSLFEKLHVNDRLGLALLLLR
jgi:DNA-binding NarL/FixJ family response regulator